MIDFYLQLHEDGVTRITNKNPYWINLQFGQGISNKHLVGQTKYFYASKIFLTKHQNMFESLNLLAPSTKYWFERACSNLYLVQHYF